MVVLSPVPGPEACAACRHVEPIEGHDLHVCRARALVAGADLPLALRGWPLVYPGDRCGEFVRRLEARPEPDAAEA